MELEDILADRRNHYDILWIMKTFKPKRISRGDITVTNPLQFMYKVLTDKHVNLFIEKALPNELAFDRFRKLNSILEEIRCSKNITVVRLLGLVLLKIMKKILDSVFVSEKRLLKLKNSMGKHPIVFLPTHRSYADFILMAFLCFNYDIEIPFVAAGMDFHAMLGMAKLLRQCGALYMRRSFKDDKVYASVFKKYVQNVVTYGNSPFEFFIEGTRSRCGKSLMPKLGLLKIIIELYQSIGIEDIIFVPITINYERILEDRLFTNEVIGIPKPKESTTGLLRSISLLKEHYGSIYITLGPEISLKQFEVECNDSNILLMNLAHNIVRRQQENIMLTFFNLLSTVIICELMSNHGSDLKISSLCSLITELSETLISLKAFVVCFDDIRAEIERNLKIHTFLTMNEEKNVILLSDMNRGDLPHGNSLKNAIPIIMLQHYANPCYHFLINPALIILILRSEKCIDENSLYSKFGWFRTLLKHEFLFYQPSQMRDFQNTRNSLIQLHILEVDADGKFSLNSNNFIGNIWLNSIMPYLRGYSFVCEVLNQIFPFSNHIYHIFIGLTTNINNFGMQKAIHQSFHESELKARIRKRLELKLDMENDVSLHYTFSSNFITCIFCSLIDAGILGLDTVDHFIKVINPSKLGEIIVSLEFALDHKITSERLICRL